MAGGSAILAIKIIADASQAVGELNKVGKKTGGFASAVQAAAIPAATVVTGLGAMAVAAADDAEEQQKLIKTYQKATGTTDDYSAAIDGAVAAGQDKAFTDSDVRKALQPLIIATGDATKANELLGPAMDIARLAGVDLETAAVAIAKAHEGQQRALMALIPGLEKTKDPLDTIANATAIAAGAADAYAQSAPGQLIAVADSYKELGESIGLVFLPALKEATRLAGELAGFLREHMDVVGPLAVVFGALALAILAANVALGVMALLTSPITLVFLAIAGIAAGLVLLYQNSQTFRDIVKGAMDIVAGAVVFLQGKFEELKAAVKIVFDAAQRIVQSFIDFTALIFGTILAIMSDPINAFVEVVKLVFAAVQLVIENVINTVKSIFDGVLAFLKQPFEDFGTAVDTTFAGVETLITEWIGTVSDIFGTLLAILSDPWKAYALLIKNIMDTVTGLVRDAVKVIQDIINGIASAVDSVAQTVDDINPFSATAVPGGGPVALMRGARAGRAAGGGGGGGTIVNVNVASADPEQVVRAVRRWAGRNGGSSPFNRVLDRSVM